jgi:hypothetical protein
MRFLSPRFAPEALQSTIDREYWAAINDSCLFQMQFLSPHFGPKALQSAAPLDDKSWHIASPPEAETRGRNARFPYVAADVAV